MTCPTPKTAKIANTKTACVALSGGVDSAVAAFLLMQEGWNLIGIHLRFWHDPLANPCSQQRANKCCAASSLTDAKRAASRLGIPFYVFDVSAEFYKHLVKPFFASYKRQETPNPCVLCNQFIKFGVLWEKARELGASHIATGHYAQIHAGKNCTYSLHRGIDDKKDQSYFLYRLSQEQLARTLLPLGSYKKPDVIAIAKREGLLPTNHKESQDLCFVPETGLKPLLRQHLGEIRFKPGPIIDQQTGKQIGIHDGLPSYTIGQRRGIAIGGQGTPLYVIAKKPRANVLVVGAKTALQQRRIGLTDLHFISGSVPKSGTPLLVSVRYHSAPQLATYHNDAEKIWLEFNEPQMALTPGQSAVIYKNNRVLGGGIMRANTKS